MIADIMRPPLISIIIPVYNGAALLGRCLEAVAASDYEHYECIVVDDGSTDDSRAVASRFPVRLLELDGGPRGPAYARNRGAGAAGGDILFFIDADVMIAPDTLTRIAATFARYPGIDAVFGSYDDSPAVGSPVSQFKNLFHHFVHQTGSTNAVTFWSGCGAVRRAVFLAMGGFDEGRYPRPSIEDIELGYRMTAAGHQIMLNKEIQVKHLKRWTLHGMVKSDVFDRAIPWTLLIMRDRHLPNDLNLRLSQRVSMALAYGLLLYPALLAILYLLSIPLSPRMIIPWLLIILFIGLLNRDLYTFFIRKRGLAFLFVAFPLHILYYIYSGLAFVGGAALHFLGKQNRRRAVGPENLGPRSRNDVRESHGASRG
jgi:glycosyltransferase involved in cell wall biosynthesis